MRQGECMCPVRGGTCALELCDGPVSLWEVTEDILVPR